MNRIEMVFDIDYLCQLAEEEALENPRFYNKTVKSEWDEDYKTIRVLLINPEKKVGE